MDEQHACRTCRFWTRPEDRRDYRDPVHVYRPEDTEAQHEERQQAWNSLYGECGKPVFCPTEDEVSLDDPPPMVTRDGSEYMATLFTLATFACRAWERGSG